MTDTLERIDRAGDVILRAKYKQGDRDDMAKSGEAMKDGSYPIKDAEDLKNAIHAVGRGGASHNAIRKHIMARAKALGLSGQIPDNWNADGSLSDANAADPDLEERADDEVNCPTCDGKGTIMAGHRDCPDCGGSGTVTPEKAAKMKSAKSASPAKTGRARLYSEEFRAELRTSSEIRSVRQMDPDSRVAQRFEMREVDNGTGGSSLRFSGYASIVETPYEVSDMFGPYQETIARNAFAKTLKDGAAVNFLCNHDGVSMATTRAGTLKLSSDSTGLYTEATLNLSRPDVQIVRAAVADGDLDEMSFAFRATKQEWDEDYTARMIQEVNLHQGDVSVVNFGANPATGGTVALRSRLDVYGITFDDLYGALSELRAGASISAANMKTLSTVLSLVDAADTNVDHALVELSHMMGVKNPDIAQDAAMDKDDPSKNSPPSTTDQNSKSNGEEDPPASGSTSRKALVLPDYTDEQRARLAAIRAGRKSA